MKTNISIVLNIILVATLFMMYAVHEVRDHYYKEFTGFVLSSCAAQIEAGNSLMVRDVLNQVHGRPSYEDLTSIYRKLNAEKPAESSKASVTDRTGDRGC
ncbi:hypothetical protein BH11VER1_BH11VER1_11260 [soil metagenome]